MGYPAAYRTAVARKSNQLSRRARESVPPPKPANDNIRLPKPANDNFPNVGQPPLGRLQNVEDILRLLTQWNPLLRTIWNIYDLLNQLFPPGRVMPFGWEYCWTCTDPTTIALFTEKNADGTLPGNLATCQAASSCAFNYPPLTNNPLDPWYFRYWRNPSTGSVRARVHWHRTVVPYVSLPKYSNAPQRLPQLDPLYLPILEPVFQPVRSPKPIPDALAPPGSERGNDDPTFTPKSEPRYAMGGEARLNRERPGKRTKEKKFKGGSVTNLIHTGLIIGAKVHGKGVDLRDFLRALYDAMPNKVRKKLSKEDKKRLPALLKFVYDHIDSIGALDEQEWIKVKDGLHTTEWGSDVWQDGGATRDWHWERNPNFGKEQIVERTIMKGTPFEKKVKVTRKTEAFMNILEEILQDLLGGFGDSLRSKAARRNAWLKYKIFTSPRFPIN